MSDASLVVQRPTTQASQLVLLFHGFGSTPSNMAGVGRQIAAIDAKAFVVSVAAPYRSDLGQGLQWISVTGLTEGNRPERVAAALPLFVETIRRWQSDANVPPEATTLIGFSQGAIMALESAAGGGSAIAARVIAVSGRFARLPELMASGVTVHLVHGDEDTVMVPAHSIEALAHLAKAGVPTSIDVVPGLGHGIDGRVLGHILNRVPARRACLDQPSEQPNPARGVARPPVAPSLPR